MENGGDKSQNGTQSSTASDLNLNVTKPIGSSDEKGTDSADNITAKPKTAKGKKRKKPKDTTAPRQPLTGRDICFLFGLN